MDHDYMDGDIRKLLVLLKKILKNHPQGSEQISKFLDQKSVDLNLCFLTFVSMSPEDLNEFEEMYHEFMNHSEEVIPRRDDPKYEFKLDPDDIDFLKKHGIRF